MITSPAANPAAADAIGDLGVSLVGGAHVRLGWTDAFGAAVYRVYRSDEPLPGSFGQLAETRASCCWSCSSC